MCERARVCVYMHVCVSIKMESTTYRIHLALPNAKKPTEIMHQIICVCVRARVYMHVCVSVNMESTTYRIHLALPNANNRQR